MILKINASLSRMEAFVFALCSMSIEKMTWLFLGLALSGRFALYGVQFLMWGEISYNWVDSVFMLFMGGVYLYFTHALGKFLLDLHLNAEEVKEGDV